LKNMNTMKKLSSSLLLLLTVVFVLFATSNAKANRAAAGEIAYKWVSDSTYLLTYTFYRDCIGATPEPNTVNLCYYNTCNLDRGNVTLTKKTPLGANGQPVQNVCAGAAATQCSAPGSTIKGYRKWVYEGTVTLPSKCDSWHFVVSIALRNAGITNYNVPAGSNNLYTESTLNNIDAPTSSSPTFGLDPIQYMCAGEKQHFTYSGTDADGDVLTYSLIDPASAADNQTTCTFPPTPTSYAFGGALSGTSLINNPFRTGATFNLDASTGLMSFIPQAATAQLPQLALLVTKRRGTKVVGTVIREMQFVISSACASAGSAFTVNTAAPSSGVLAAMPPGPPTTGVIVCPNVPHRINFSITATAGATINNITDNHGTFSATSSTSTVDPYTGVGTSNVVGNFYWTPVELDEGQQYLVVKSEVCLPGQPKLYRVDSIPIYVTLTVETIPNKDTFICLGEMARLCALPKTVAGIPTLNYNWCTTNTNTAVCTGTLGITTATSDCTDVYPSSTTTYLVEITNLPAYCKRLRPGEGLNVLNTNQDEVKVVVVNPKIDAGPDTVMCSYSQLQLNGNLTTQPELTYVYKWRVNPLPGMGSANPMDFLTDSTIINPICRIPKDYPFIPDSIEYILQVIPNEKPSCARQDTIRIQILKGFYITTGDQLGTFTGLGHQGRQKGVSDTTICNGQSIAIEGWGDQRYNYVWTPSTGVSTPNAFVPGAGMTITPTGTTTYSLSATRAGCRDSTKLVVINIDPTPTADIGADRSICFGDTINMYATITPDPSVYTKYSYKWSPGGALERADTFFTYFTGYISQKIYFSVQTPAGCTGTDSVTYTVQPRSFLTPSNDTSICPGDVANISVAGDPLLKSVTWKPLTNIDSIHSLTPIVSPTFTTEYVVIGVDSNQCIDSTSVTVTVHPRTLIYLPDSATIYPGDVYELNPQGNSLYYTWFPPIGLDLANIANPKASPLLNTTYYVTGVSDAGCIAKDSIYIFVAPDSYIDIPNAFVPGRGDNNIFKPLHLGNATLKSFTIYNRWGMKVFESQDINKGWDGNFGGQPQPLGVYVYVLEAVTANGKVITKQGNVTLVR